MELTIMLFAGLVERFGSTRITIETDTNSITAAVLLQKLMDKYPEHAGALKPCFFAVNQEYASPDQEITESDELALIPPVSGGQNPERYIITHEPINPDNVADKVRHPNHGAALVFIGTTREMTASERTVRLEYEAYIPMALKTLVQIGEEIKARWTGVLCAITHRLGLVEIGEISVVIAVSAPHRDDCYEASRYAIERLKQIVPIWKKEIWDNGEVWKGHQQGPWKPLV